MEMFLSETRNQKIEKINETLEIGKDLGIRFRSNFRIDRLIAL